MRCSSCEPLLDQYAQRELAPRALSAVAEHVRACRSCASLYEELRSIDGLLLTAKRSELPVNFTFAAMAEVRGLPAPRTRGLPFLVALAFYVACVWIVVVAMPAFLHGGNAALSAAISHLSLGSGWEALTGILRAIGPIVPPLALALVLVLALDVALLVALWYFYRTLRPHLFSRVASQEQS